MVVASAIAVGTACDSNPAAPAPDAPATFEVQVSGESFSIHLIEPAQISAATQALASGRVGVISGTLATGDGGFNEPYGWHMVPQSVHFPDLAIEVCDGRPNSDVEGNLAYWLDNIGQYCPWGARVIRRVD